MTSERPHADSVAEVSEQTDLCVGVPLPLGIHEHDGGINFAVFSRHANPVRLTVDGATTLRAERDGKTIFFCSDHRQTKLLSTPASAPEGQVTAAQDSTQETKGTLSCYITPRH